MAAFGRGSWAASRWSTRAAPSRRPTSGGATTDMSDTQADPYAASEAETSQGRVFTVTGQDWDSVVSGINDEHDNKVVVNMGPQHPSTHGVLRLILELE